MSQISFLLVSIVDSALLVGMIFTIQWVHYPSFKFVSPNSFSSFHAFHSLRITRIVAPLMILELALSAYGLWAYPSQSWVWMSAGLVAIAWISTLLWQIPLHQKLALSFEPQLMHHLVRSNYLRTFAWTSKMILLSWVFGKEIR